MNLVVVLEPLLCNAEEIRILACMPACSFGTIFPE